MVQGLDCFLPMTIANNQWNVGLGGPLGHHFDVYALPSQDPEDLHYAFLRWVVWQSTAICLLHGWGEKGKPRMNLNITFQGHTITLTWVYHSDENSDKALFTLEAHRKGCMSSSYMIRFNTVKAQSQCCHAIRPPQAIFSVCKNDLAYMEEQCWFVFTNFHK